MDYLSFFFEIFWVDLDLYKYQIKLKFFDVTEKDFMGPNMKLHENKF